MSSAWVCTCCLRRHESPHSGEIDDRRLLCGQTCSAVRPGSDWFKEDNWINFRTYIHFFFLWCSMKLKRVCEIANVKLHSIKKIYLKKPERDSSPKNENFVILYSPSSSFSLMWNIEDILKNAGNQFMVPIDFYNISLNVNGDCLVLQNIFFCVQQERNSYRFGTTWGWVKDDKMFIFLVNYSFKSTYICNLETKYLYINSKK